MIVATTNSGGWIQEMVRGEAQASKLVVVGESMQILLIIVSRLANSCCIFEAANTQYLTVDFCH